MLVCWYAGMLVVRCWLLSYTLPRPALFGSSLRRLSSASQRTFRDSRFECSMSVQCSLFGVHESFRAQLPGANHPRTGDIMLLWVAR